MARQRSAGLVLLLIFLASHLAFLPRTLEDLDSINFALGVRDFDVARHQPHPPGYPVFIALGKISTAALRAMGIGAPAPRGLAVWSAIAGAAALPALLMFFTTLEGRRRVAWWATLVTATAPLYWFTALRPLSDMTGFAVAIWAIALLVGASPARVIAGALLLGLAAGIRSQTAVLTVPVLAYVLLSARTLTTRDRALAVAAVAVGGLCWAVPLVIVSGGPSGYLAALGAQAGEDFSGVTMLWTQHGVRQILAALAFTFVWPWDWWLGVGVVAIAVLGAVRIAWRTPRAIAMLALVFGPYAVFHLLFQEVVTTRYALPLLPAAAYLAIAALETRSRIALPLAASAIAGVSLLGALPASATYAIDGAPVFQAFDDMAITAHGGERVDTIAMHAGARRAAEWVAPILPARVAKAPHGREWLALVALWRADPRDNVWFAADPVRTDLALFDPRSRDLARAYRWGFVEPPFVGGARPSGIDWYHMRPPGWMLDRGWDLTAEVAGITARDNLGAHLAPSTAWVRSRTDETLLVIGGRYLGDGTATLRLSANGTHAADITVQPGFFVRHLPLPAGTFTSPSAYVPLEVSAVGSAHGPVKLEQFDLQSAGIPMFAFEEGWQEPEFNVAFGHSWRWMSERSVLWLRETGQPIVLQISGEGTRRYYKEPARVRVLAGERELGTIDTSADFEQTLTVPPDALSATQGRLVFQSSQFFVPGSDPRHLAVRIYSIVLR